MNTVKTFISYSWTNPIHEQWVLNLATELRESGVDVILDKWDLKEGHDTLAFMEKMVSDPEIKKVLMVCDKKYADKADHRNGGVGTEAQIISQEVYEKQTQEKFVAAVVEKDENGKPCLPIYYKSRMYIDFTDLDKYSESLEQLVRWIYDEPFYKKPALGKKPIFLDNEQSISLKTVTIHKRLTNALKEGKTNVGGILNEYLNTFVENLEEFRITRAEGEYDDALIENIKMFLPYRNEFIEVIINVCQYAPENMHFDHFHKFFENIIHYTYRPQNITSFYEYDWDNFKFMINELFLYFVAVLLKYERFEQLDSFLNEQFYDENSRRNNTDPMVNFTHYRYYLKSLEIRKSRLGLNLYSLQSHLIKNRAEHSTIKFNQLMQADFILYLRSELHRNEMTQAYYPKTWFPDTLIYAVNEYKPFEIFARAQSKAYFDKMKCILDINDKNQLDKLFTEFETGKINTPKWDIFETFYPCTLGNSKKLSTLK